MITYEQFLMLAEKLGFSASTYLPEEINYYKDSWEYTVPDIAEYSGKSPVTVRKWFKEGKIKAYSKNPWVAIGIDVKRKLFIEHYDFVKYHIKAIANLDEKNMQRILDN